jgi:polar amino acid transport system substrate-binding protein
MKMTHKILFLLVCFLTTLGFAQNSESLRVGMELASPPFEMIDKQGKPTGISVDIAYALGSYLGKPVVIQNIPFVGLIPSLKSGKIDLIISSMTVTEERKKSIDFSDPYLEVGLSLLLPKDSSIQSVQELNNSQKTIVVKQGTTGQIYAEKHLQRAKLRPLDKESACVLEIVQKKADAFIYDEISIVRNWKKNPETTRALMKPFALEAWAMGIRKGNEELLQKVNAFLKDFKSSNELEKLKNKYE